MAIDVKSFVSQLVSKYKTAGVINENIIINSDLEFSDIDEAYDELSRQGILITNDTAQNNNTNFDKDNFGNQQNDYDQLDYEQLYTKIILIEPNLHALVNRAKKIKPPQWRESRDLLPHVRSGNQYAKKRISEMYLRDVLRIALRWHELANISLEDAVQEGFIGLNSAIDNSDSEGDDKIKGRISWRIWECLKICVIW